MAAKTILFLSLKLILALM
jgi:hypothetical protein